MLILFRKKVLLLCCILATASNVANAQIRILTIGDSTMADYDEEKNSGIKEMRGWAQMLPVFFNENVKIDNAAKNGRSSKSFHIEFWNNLRETLKPGDYLFIQFGHNDEKNKGLDDEIGSPKRRGTAAWGQYQKYLAMYINDAREKGAIPILLTPVVRRLFENDTIVGIGRHSLTEIAPDDSTMNYPKAMRALAKELSVPLVDMTELTKQLVEGLGAEKAKEIIYATDDNTHLKAMGGILFSELAVKDLLRQGILTDYITLANGLTLKPSSYDFGTQFTGRRAVKAFSLTGLRLEPENGNIVIRTTEPFSVSLAAKDNYSEQIKIPYKNGNISKTIYLMLNATDKPECISKNIHVELNKNTNQEIEVNAQIIDGKNSKPVSINWNTDQESEPQVTKGEIEINYSLENLKFHITDSINYISTTDNYWPAGDIDLDASRYIGLTITAPEKTLYIDSVSINIGCAGSNRMRFTALCSTESNFSTFHTLANMEVLPDNKTKVYSFNRIIEIPQKQTLYIRIYPWHTEDATDKYIWIKNIKINGLIPD